MIYFLYLTVFLALSNLSFCDEEDSMNWKVYPLKGRVHALCSGHGAFHLTEDELNVLFNKFSEHYQDVLSLVREANSDNY